MRWVSTWLDHLACNSFLIAHMPVVTVVFWLVLWGQSITPLGGEATRGRDGGATVALAGSSACAALGPRVLLRGRRGHHFEGEAILTGGGGRGAGARGRLLVLLTAKDLVLHGALALPTPGTCTRQKQSQNASSLSAMNTNVLNQATEINLLSNESLNKIRCTGAKVWL